MAIRNIAWRRIHPALYGGKWTSRLRRQPAAVAKQFFKGLLTGGVVQLQAMS
jgi:hypothetical protein